MRYQGKLTTWKDDQGFGFVTPNGGGRQVFIHISSFPSRSGRPAGGEIVTYELLTNDRGQLRAERAAFVGMPVVDREATRSGTTTLILALLFLAGIAIAVIRHKLPLSILGLYFGASSLAFAAYWSDKSAARNNRWRIRESTLHIFGLVGGWPGALIAQRVFRHKSKKQPFQVKFWATVLLNCFALVWIFSGSGVNVLRILLSVQ